MASALDFSKFTFTVEEIRDIRDLIWDEIVKAPEFTDLFTVYPDVVAGKQVGFIGKGGLIIKADTGCGSAPANWQIGTHTITWEPKAWEAYVRECYADLQQTAAVYAMNKGVKVADLTNTDYMAIVVDVLSEAIKESIFAQAMFGDTTDGGEFNSLINGFYKQMQTQITVNAKQSVSLDTTNIIADVLKLIQAASPVLRADRTAKIYASQKVYDAILAGLVSANASTMAYANLVNGTEVRILGIPVVALPLMDEVATLLNVASDFCFLSAPKYLGIAVDSENFGEVSVDYDPATKYTHIRALGKMDAKLTNPEMFVFGKLA